jgi:hypothetical protein
MAGGSGGWVGGRVNYYYYWCALGEDEMLEDDDLKLLEENTGETFVYRKNKLTCLRCGSNSRSPPIASTSRCKSVLKDLCGYGYRSDKSTWVNMGLAG